MPRRPDTLFTILSSELASRFPTDGDPEVRGLAEGESHRCECGGALEPIVITTWSPVVPVLWRTRPLALDGWRCASCERIVAPAMLSAATVRELTERGVSAAAAGDLDEGELCFRRVTASWPTYSTGLVNLASLMVDRARRARADQDEAAARAHVAEAIRYYAAALDSEPAPPPLVLLALGRLLLTQGETSRAIELLQRFCATPDVRLADVETARELLRRAQGAPEPA
jgi:tetratricopeptide (TPR) repeat protein